MHTKSGYIKQDIIYTYVSQREIYRNKHIFVCYITLLIQNKMNSAYK